MSGEATKTMAEVHVTSIPDVCLALPGDAQGLRIFANISVLRNASPVFHVLLGPHFLEGQIIASDRCTTQDLQFPDDSPKDMLLLLQVLHQRFRDIQQAVGSPDFRLGSMRAIAVLADKYDVCQAVNMAFPLIVNLRNLPSVKCTESLWSTLTASYIVGNREVFKVASTALILRCNVAYSTFIKGHDAPLMLEEARARLRATVSSIIAHNLSNLIDNIEPETDDDDSDDEAGHLFYWDDNDDKRHHVEDLMPQLAYDSFLERTLADLDEDRGDDPSGILQGAFDDLKNEANMGICFDCVGHRGEHKDHAMEL